MFNLYLVCRKLNMHVQKDKEFNHLIGYGAGNVKAEIGVRKLEKLQSLLIFNFRLW